MAKQSEVVIHFSEAQESDVLHNAIEDRCQRLGENFPEAMRFEVSVLSEGDGFTAHAHVVGRKVNLAATQDGSKEAGAAADQALHKLESQMRKHHDRLRTEGRRKGRGLRQDRSDEEDEAEVG